MRFTVAFLFCLLTAQFLEARDLVIGVVDLQRLVTEYPGTAKAEKKLSALFADRKNDLGESEKELASKEQELAKSKSVLSSVEFETKKDKYKKEEEDLLQQENQFNNDVQNKRAEMVKKVLDDIKGLAATVAKNKGVDMVLGSDSLVYAKDTLDLTDDVLKSFKDLDTSDDSKK